MDYIISFKPKLMEKVIFHGACLACNSQELFGKIRCLGCSCFEHNWKLPNLSLKVKEEREKLEIKRAEFKNAINLN